MILAIKTAGIDAEAGIYLGQKQITETKWSPGRKLSQELLPKIEELLALAKIDWADLTGIVVFRGPGSFTSLRIGITVANTLAYGLNIPVVGTEGENWIEDGLKQIEKAPRKEIVTPYYGAEPNITQPKK